MLGLALSFQLWAEGSSVSYEQALVSYNKGEIRTAYIHLKNALKEDPLLLAPHLLLARIYLAMGNGAEAEEELLIADRLGAHRSLILVPLAKAYLQQGKNQQLIDELFPVGTAPEQDSELLTLRGQAHLALGEIFDAERAFDQAWRRAPDSQSALLGRAQTRLQRGALPEAMEDARRAVELAPRDAQAWYLKAIIERDLGKTDEALADFEKTVELEPAHLPAQIGRVGLLVDDERIEEAAAVIANVRESYPRDPRALYLEAVVANKRGDTRTAERALQESASLLSQLPADLVKGHAPTLLLAGVVSFSLKKWEQAGDYLELYIRQNPREVGPRKLLAQILLDRGQDEAAITLLEPAAQDAPDDPGLASLLAEAYTQAGLHLKASQLLDRAIRLDSKNMRVRTQQAVTSFFLGRSREAIDQLGAIFSSWPELDSAGPSLVVMLLQKHQSARAVMIADQIVDKHPDNITYINLQGAARFSHGDTKGARDSFKKALEIDPWFLPARLNLAKLDLEEGDVASAQLRLKALVDEHPKQASIMLELARTFEKQGNFQEAERWARQAVDADPDSVQAVTYLSDLLLALKQPEEALKVAEGMELRQPDNVSVLEAVSRAYLAKGERSTAQVVLQRTSTLAGYDARQLEEIALLQQDAGDLDGAVWSLQKAVEAEPDYLPSRIRLGELLAALGRIEKADLVAKELQRDYPDGPYGYHLMGTIQQRAGDYAGALKSYRAALDREESPLLAVRVYEAQREAEGEEAGAEFLLEWLEERPQDVIVRQALAEGYFRAGRFEEAQTLFEQSLREDPESPLLLNNLALVYARTGDPRALAYAKKAYDLLPDVPDVGDTLGWILVRDGQHLEGLKYLREAQSRAAGDPGIGYHIAVALNELGRADEALTELERAMGTQSSFMERKEAEEMLERLRGSNAGGS